MSQSSNQQDTVTYLENIHDYFTALLEYYDELFPLADGAVTLITALGNAFRAGFPPEDAPLCRYLGIGCATGALENRLAGGIFDITGIDANADMIATARRRMRRGLSSTRFFELSILEMGRYLKKGSFNLIACLENTLPFLGDEILARKFFHDAKALLAPGGVLAVQTLNFDGLPEAKPVRLPDRSSIRVRLETGYRPKADGTTGYDAEIELGNGKRIVLQKGGFIVPTPTAAMESWAKGAGFARVERYGGYDKEPFSPKSENVLMLFR